MTEVLALFAVGHIDSATPGSSIEGGQIRYDLPTIIPASAGTSATRPRLDAELRTTHTVRGMSTSGCCVDDLWL